VKKLMMTLSLAAAPAAFCAPAAAQCVTIDPVVVPDLRIDPLDATGPAQVMQPTMLNFRRTGSDTAAPLTVIYQILDEDSTVQSRVGASAGPQIEWRSNDSGNNIAASRSEAYALLRSAKVTLDPTEASKQSGLRLFLTNLREDLPAGVYREQFTLRYWCDATELSMPYESPGIVTVTVQVPNVLSANIAGASSHGEIDFLDFAARSRSLAVSVRSTGRYAVTARSLNGSAMVREGSGGASGADRIAYEVRFGGQPLTLGSEAGFVNPRAGLGGEQIPLEVEVEDVSDKRAGTYADTLILTLAPVA